MDTATTWNLFITFPLALNLQRFESKVSKALLERALKLWRSLWFGLHWYRLGFDELFQTGSNPVSSFAHASQIEGCRAYLQIT